MHRVEGKGLSGFIFGLLFATAAIGGVLYFLNHTPSGIREEAKNPVEKAPEVLTPKGAPNRQVAAAPAVRPTSEPVPAVSEVRVPLEQPKAVSEVAVATTAIDAVQASEPRGRRNAGSDKPSAVAAAENDKPAQTAARRHAETVAETENKAAGRRAAAETADKPTERRTAETKADDNRAATPPRRRQNEERAETARRPAPSAARGNRIVQMGAYGSAKAADAQQAKLALMGIPTQVERATTANGQTVYRVHSGGVSAEEAGKISRVLNENGVEHITRSAR